MADLRTLRERYLEAQLAGDRNTALRLLLDEGVRRGVDASLIQLEVIQPAQYEIGRLWQENRISVAQEHLATGISQLVLAHLYPFLTRAPRNGRLALVACVDGELHDMGARIAADHLEMRGFDVRYLGASVPLRSLAELVARERPDVVALSVTMPQHLRAARETVEALCERDAPGVRIALGGHAFADVPGFPGADGRVVSCGTLADFFDKVPWDRIGVEAA